MFGLPNRSSIAVALAGLVASSLLAGPPPVRRNGTSSNGAVQNPENQNLVTKFEGKLKTFRQGMLLVRRDDGVDVMVQPPKDISKFQFVAAAKPEFLRQGMMVRAGQVPVRVPLVPSATFKIRYNNLSLAQIGDSVKVAGFYNAPDDTRVRADSVTITTDRIYGQPIVEDSKRKRPKRERRRRRKEKEAESEDETERTSPEPE